MGNETASYEFQALLAKVCYSRFRLGPMVNLWQLSELYGQDNADRLAAFMPLFESTMNDGSSEFGDSTMSAPTPGGGFVQAVLPAAQLTFCLQHP